MHGCVTIYVLVRAINIISIGELNIAQLTVGFYMVQPAHSSLISRLNTSTCILIDLL